MRTALLALLLTGCDPLRAVVVDHYPNAWDASVGVAEAAIRGVLRPTIDGPDARRTKVPVVLRTELTGLQQPTDIQFPPGRNDTVVVLEKTGRARRFSGGPDWVEQANVLQLRPLTESEQGLLGLAFHPKFGADGGRVFVHHSLEEGGQRLGRISAFSVTISGDAWTTGPLETVLDVVQPYANHDGGQLQFGPDGYLYIGFGDGGWRADPQGNGQNAATLLGSMLRIDVDGRAENRPVEGRPYRIPADNPFLDQPDTAPEAWAIGLRNPWRYSFSPEGLLLVADVGQDQWEEVDLVGAGDNLGWNTREGRHCFPGDKPCESKGLVDPIYEYQHGEDGVSITGGYVWTAPSVPALSGRFVFGDFVSGRIWALAVPPATSIDAVALGRFDIMVSTFGRNAAGEVFVGDFKTGAVYRISAP